MDSLINSLASLRDTLLDQARVLQAELAKPNKSPGCQRRLRQEFCALVTHIERLTHLTSAGERDARSTTPLLEVSVLEALPTITGFRPADADFVQLLAKARRPDGFHCSCGSLCSLLIARRAWRCPSCGRQRAVCEGTVLSGSHLKLESWFRAVAELSANPGIGAHALARRLNLKRPGTARRLIRLIGSLDVKGPVESHEAIAGILVRSRT